MQNDNYNKLKSVLTEIFQLNQADLDFGIYRILNQKRKDIEHFLDKKLMRQVKDILKQSGIAGGGKKKKELQDMENALRNAGMNPDDSPKIIELRKTLKGSDHLEVLEQQVFSHLTTFFRRYYDKGDFISKRRYKADTYAIPYEGEEVKLYWANHDQYYIKTSEYLKNYGFKLSNGKKIQFQLIEASSEKDNNKNDRYFKIYAEQPLLLQDEKTLLVQFTYEPSNKKLKQADCNKAAFEALQTAFKAGEGRFKDFVGMFVPAPTEKNKSRTLISKHIKDFTARNTFDYFIHKDLGKFLRRELDFYIKTEILQLDDINYEQPESFVEQLAKINAFRSVSHKLIDFLAQLEDFQKRLWLKKKFVVDTQYCITLDRIPEALYPKIAENKAQWKEWQELFAIDEIETDLFHQVADKVVSYGDVLHPETKAARLQLIRTQPYLVLDTAFFSNDFKDRLLASVDNIDAQLDGLLIHSENFQALNLLQNRYKEQVKCIYIDPPYNTGSDGFAYKDNFQHSSWITCLENRITTSINLCSQDGAFFISIDDGEHKNLNALQEEILGAKNFVSNIIWQKKYSPQNDAKWLSDNHDFITCFAKNKNTWFPTLLPRTKEQNSRYKNPDNDPRGSWKPTDLSVKTYSAQYDYSITTPSGRIVTPPKGRCWGIGKDGFQKLLNENRIWFGELGSNVPCIKRFLTDVKQGITPLTIWTYNEVGHNQEGKKELIEMLRDDEAMFGTPKVVRLMKKIITIGTIKSSIILDYFAGSGTTGHAVINLNREDGGKRKYILVEMGEYFDSVTKPRIQKVIYSDAWKDGKPTSRKGSSHAFKYIRLESYEDVLNNLQIQSKTQGLSLTDSFKEDYTLRYWLDVETRDSLLNVQSFRKPFDYTLNITQDNESKSTKIDLVETFNYLIGLQVISIQSIEGFKVVTGKTIEAQERSLIIWRDLDDKDNAALNAFFQKQQFNTRDSEFDRIYVNGDNNLENLKTEEDRWKVEMIEEVFLKEMFATT